MKAIRTKLGDCRFWPSLTSFILLIIWFGASAAAVMIGGVIIAGIWLNINGTPVVPMVGSISMIVIGALSFIAASVTAYFVI